MCNTAVKMFLLLFFINLLGLSLALKDPVVRIPLGEIRGDFDTSQKGREFYSFKGIPYAKPPVGERRFQKSEPIESWNDVWVAKTLYICMQYNHYTPPGGDYVIGDEDCLYLNVYTPTLDQNANLDVIVYIHGGAFMFNHGGIQRPHYLMDRNVVCVTLNYRLGPLGFLSTENELVPGNNGIKDQALALKFVKDNIKFFGGNPDSVTTMGMSAGGASVHLHFMNPSSRNLFHKAISQSGVAWNHWVLMEKALEKTKKLGALVGCSTENLALLVECLREKPGRQITYAVKEFQPWLYNPFSPFGVVVDGQWSSDPVLTDHPYNLVKSGNIADKPWIASHTSSEGLYPASDFYAKESYLEDIDNRWNELLPHILDYNFTVERNLQDTVSQQIRKHYLGEKKVSRETFREFVDILSDRIFVNDIRKCASLQASVMKSPVFFYYFTYRGTYSLSQIRAESNVDLGASHGDDTCYVFGSWLNMPSTEADKKMVELFLDIVTSFAKTGKPKVPKVEWVPLSKNPSSNLFNYLKIEGPDKLATESIYNENVAFWDSLPINENEKLVVDSSVKQEL